MQTYTVCKARGSTRTQVWCVSYRIRLPLWVWRAHLCLRFSSPLFMNILFFPLWAEGKEQSHPEPEGKADEGAPRAEWVWRRALPLRE